MVNGRIICIMEKDDSTMGREFMKEYLSIASISVVEHLIIPFRRMVVTVR